LPSSFIEKFRIKLGFMPKIMYIRINNTLNYWLKFLLDIPYTRRKTQFFDRNCETWDRSRLGF
jgi:hypothetical protein